jgi:predicted dehydrogenase
MGADARIFREGDMPNVRWGILSTADIGMSKVIPAIQRAQNCDVVAIASRDLQRAADAANQLGIARAHGTYEELLDADDIDAVYIPLPNDMHSEWTLKAAAAGKHVLCEKPLAMSSSQGLEMMSVCEQAGVKLQEAFMYRHHPTWLDVARRVRSGEIGELQAVQSAFSYFNDDPENIRNRMENGGGAMMDVGCYSVNLSRLLFDSEPVRVESVVRRDPEMDVDIVTSAVLEFEGGGQSTFTCSTRAEDYQRVHVFGSQGRIEVEIPFNIPPDTDTRLFLTRGEAPTETVVFPPADQYTIQAELFAQAILEDAPVPVPATDAVANMRVVEAILAAR